MKIALSQLKPWMMPVAMLTGAVFHEHISSLQPLVPYLIFTMLLIAFCKVKPSEFRVTSLSWSLLSIQLGGSAAVYLLLRGAGADLAQAAFICILCPTATAAPVVTGMLGGNVARLATYSIISNIAAAIAAPAVHRRIARYQAVSFYLWSVSLIVAVGGSVSYIMSADASKIPEIILIALVAGVICVFQFAVGRKIGRACGDRIAGAQGLAQKNTILAIWMALTYLNPISSVGPAAYIVWQNSINSMQLYLKTKKDANINRARDVNK